MPKSFKPLAQQKSYILYMCIYMCVYIVLFENAKNILFYICFLHMFTCPYNIYVVGGDFFLWVSICLFTCSCLSCVCNTCSLPFQHVSYAVTLADNFFLGLPTTQTFFFCSLMPLLLCFQASVGVEMTKQGQRSQRFQKKHV